MTWVAVLLEPVSPGSAIPAYGMSCTIEATADFIGTAKLHGSGGGPHSSWLPSMALPDVEATIDYLYDILMSGTNLVSWGGLEAFTLFTNYDLSADHRRRLHHVTIKHFDLKTAYFFGLTGTDSSGTDELIASAPDAAKFPFSDWLSGSRTQQMAAVQFSIDMLVFMSKLFFQLDHAYFEDGRNICIESLCDDQHVVHTFGHSPTHARRLSTSVQDNIERFI